jgi:hypothetical protein
VTPNWRIVPCLDCGTEGRIYITDYDQRGSPDNYWGERDIGPCESCDGTGGEIVETFLIELADLDQIGEAVS